MAKKQATKAPVKKVTEMEKIKNARKQYNKRPWVKVNGCR